MPEPLEAARTRSLLSHLRRVWGGSWWKIHGGPFQPRFVDIVGCLRGLFIALEVKRPHKRPTPAQVSTMDDVIRSGGVAGVVWSAEDIDWGLSRGIDNSSDFPYGRGNLVQTEWRERKGEAHNMPSRRNRTGKSGTKSKAKVQEPEELEEDEGVDDLDDLEDIEAELDELELDEAEDEESEDDEDEEVEEAPPAKKAKASKTTKASKNGKEAPVAEKSNRRGNVANLVVGKTLPEGMAGPNDIAKALKTDAKVVRRHLRKLGVDKTDGLYQWKPGKSLEDVARKVKKSIEEAAEKAAANA